MIKQEYDEDNGFEERAEYIFNDYFLNWNVDIPYFNSIQRKLIEKGTKVIVGPRGSGKTHQMMIAHFNCIDDKTKPFPVYTSFGKYYHLEPLLSKNPAAITVFHTWVLCKILLAADETFYTIKNKKVEYFFNDIKRERIELFIAQSEKNVQESWHDDIIRGITIQYVLNFITDCMISCKRKRTILLLDDAALTLTKEYMIEFFDIFRSLKTTNISPKASVYPGTTEYGPRFHLKQDGDPFIIWFDPFGNDYTEFINQLCEKRFNDLNIDQNIKELLKYASFGIPRAFITLLRDFHQSTSNSIQVTFNSTIDIRCKLIKDEYISIKQKLSQYSMFIDVGWEFFEAILNEITQANKGFNKNDGEKQIIIGLLDYRDASIERMIKFLIEAGLLYELSQVKHGENREYRRFIPHLIFLLQKRAFTGSSRGFNINEILDFLARKNVKHPLRKDNIYNILSNDVLKNLKLDLPPCTNCGENRLSENQKYCHACGHELVSKSSFERCMQLTIDELPLTEWQKNKIKEETALKTVKDFVSILDIGDELTKPHGFGKKKAQKISEKVKVFIEEFLT